MPRKFLNSLLPDREALHARLHGKWYVRPFDFLLHEPALWHIGRRGTSVALALGAFICCLPMPGHMLLAVLGAIYWRVNLPVAVAAVWINNPLTIGPIYYFAYKLGKWLMLALHMELEAKGPLTKPWQVQDLNRAWHILAPTLLGGFVEGMIFAFFAYLSLDLAWRLSIRGRWKLRQAERLAKQKEKEGRA
jgi:hypothetical protein